MPPLALRDDQALSFSGNDRGAGTLISARSAGLCVWEVLGVDSFVIAILGIGMIFAMMISVYAVIARRRSKRRVHLGFSAWASLFIGTGDFITDVAFAKVALERAVAACPPEGSSCDALSDLLQPGQCPSEFTAGGLNCGDPNCPAVAAAECCPRLCGNACEPRTEHLAFGGLALGFVLLPMLLSVVPVTRLMRSGLRDMGAWNQDRSFYWLLTSLSLTNLEFLKLVPWVDDKYDGFPRSWMLKSTFFTTVVEDIPQIVLQFVYIFTIQSQFGESPLSNPVPLLALVFSICSIWWRGLRKAILLMYADVGDDEEGGGWFLGMRRGASFPTSVSLPHGGRTITLEESLSNEFSSLGRDRRLSHSFPSKSSAPVKSPISASGRSGSPPPYGSARVSIDEDHVRPRLGDIRGEHYVHKGLDTAEASGSSSGGSGEGHARIEQLKGKSLSPAPPFTPVRRLQSAGAALTLERAERQAAAAPVTAIAATEWLAGASLATPPKVASPRRPLSRSVSLDDLGVDGDDQTWGSFPVGAGTALDAEGDPASRSHVARVSVDDLGVEGGGGGGGGSLGPEDIAMELGDVEVGEGDGELRRSFAFSRSSSRGSLSSPRPSSARLVCAEPHLPVRGDSAAMLAVARAEGGAAPQRARGAAPPEPRTPLRRRPSAEEVDAALEVLAAAAEEGTLREGALSVEARPAIPRLAEVTRLRRSSDLGVAVSPVGVSPALSVWTPHLGVEATPSPGRGVAVAPAAGGDSSYEPNYGITRAASIGVRSAQRGWLDQAFAEDDSDDDEESGAGVAAAGAGPAEEVSDQVPLPVRRASGAGSVEMGFPQPPPGRLSAALQRARKGNVERRRQQAAAAAAPVAAPAPVASPRSPRKSPREAALELVAASRRHSLEAMVALFPSPRAETADGEVTSPIPSPRGEPALERSTSELARSRLRTALLRSASNRDSERASEVVVEVEESEE